MPDRAAAVAAARACGGRVLIADEVSETQQVWAERNGSFTADQSDGVARFKQNGLWVNVDLTLVRAADGSVAPRAHPYGLRLAGAGATGWHDLVDVGAGASQVGLAWSGRLPAPVLSGTTATYADVVPGIDLVVQALQTGFEQFVVVKSRSALSRLKDVHLAPRAAGSIAPADGNGGLLFKNAGGAVVARSPQAMMWDAAIDAHGAPANQRPAGLSLTTTHAADRAAGIAHILAFAPDQTWLASAARHFPITLDPATVVQTTSMDTYAGTGLADQSASTTFAVGTSNSGATKRIAYLNFTTASVPYAHINWATVKAWLLVANSCAAGTMRVFGTIQNAWAGMTWNNRVDLRDAYGNDIGPNSGSAGNMPAAFGASTAPASGCTGQWLESDATALFQYAANRAWGEFTVALAPYWDDTNDYYKQFKASESGTLPHITLNWNYPPTLNAVSTTPSTTCTGTAGAVHVSTIPQLSAQFTDPDGLAVSAKFEWYVNGGALLGSTQTGQVASGQWLTATPSQLPEGGTYAWRVQGTNGVVASNWSSFCVFTLDAQPPTGPTTSPPSACTSTAAANDTDNLPRLSTGSGVTLRAIINDVNNGTTQAQFEWWHKADRDVAGASPIGSYTTDPAAAGTTFQYAVLNTFIDSQAYSWRVRGVTAGTNKPWSPWCEFVADTVAPSSPTVTSDPGNDLSLVQAPTVPPAPPATAIVGRPTMVTFHPAAADSDVVGYLWGLSTSGGSPSRWAPANSAGVATVTIEPVASGFTVNKLTVLAVDRAGNQSTLPSQGYSYGFKGKSGAVGLWPTTGSGTTVSDTTSAHRDLTLSAGASLGSGVLTLNGNTGQATTASSAVTTTGSFTVAAWVRPTSLSSSATVLSEDGTSVSNFKLMYDASFGGWCFGQAASDSPSAALVTACASIPPTLGEWVHVVGVYDSSAATVSIYVNGGLADYTPVGSAWAASGPFVVGRGLSSGSPTERFTGDVADIRAWPLVLDATAIYALAALPPAAGRWGMDNPASFVAADGSGLAATHDATLSSGAGWGLGLVGSALTLDGSSGTAVTSGPVIRTDQSFTVSAWVNTTDTSTSTVDTVLTQEGANVGSFFLQKRWGNWAFGRPASDGGSSITWATSTTPVSASTWTHLTGVYDADAGELRLYVNGSLEATATYTSGWNSTGNFVMGRTLWPQQSKEFWPGQLDDVRVYRGVLSEWQIGNLVDV